MRISVCLKIENCPPEADPSFDGKIENCEANHMACYFCQRNIQEINYKDTETLQHFTSGMGKIKPKKKTGVCATHQRMVAREVKRARFLALLP